MIIINFKNHPEALGENFDKVISPLHQLVNHDETLSSKFMVAVPTPYVVYAKRFYPKIQIILQHVDDKNLGNTTGWIPFDLLKYEQINHVLLNHSEHRILPENYITKIQNAGIKVISCCENVEEAKLLSDNGSWGIAYEPKDLIGSGVSVSTRPDSVKNFIEVVGDRSFSFIGAGISTIEDIQDSVNLGAKGVLISTAYVKSNNHLGKAQELLSIKF